MFITTKQCLLLIIIMIIFLIKLPMIPVVNYVWLTSFSVCCNIQNVISAAY